MIKYLKNNKTYILGLVFSVLIPLFMMLLYWNKSISNYDGWYNLYAQDFLNGRIPYLDFHFLMPPVYLYIWTLLQKIFGNYMIVFHAASVVCKCILSAAFFVTFKRFFNVKISFISSVITSSVMLFAPFDNCVLSYNEVCVLISLIIINLVISLTEILYRDNKISYIILSFIAVFNTVLFFTKQTHGIIIPFCMLFILAIVLFKNIKLKKITKDDILRAVLLYFSVTCLAAVVIFIPLMHSNSLISSYINNVYGGVSAKGSLFGVLKYPLKMMVEEIYFYPIFIISVIMYVIFILKKYLNIKMESKPQDSESEFLPNNIVSFIIFLAAIFCAYITVAILVPKCSMGRFAQSILNSYNKTGFICEIFVFLAAILYFLRYIIKNDLKDLRKLVMFAGFIAICLSVCLSFAYPYFSFFVYGLTSAMILNYVFKYSKYVEIAFFIISVLFVYITTFYKTNLPFFFHGWSSIPATIERKISKLDSLKGFRLSVQEVNIFEQMKAVTDKYLNKDDKIFAFINNTVFYNLLSRKPFYDDYYNLYWDVCPENQAMEIYYRLIDNDINKLPPVIIFFQNSEDNIILHEKYFRNGNMWNAQRHIDIVLKQFINDKTYKVVWENDLVKNMMENPKYSSIVKENIELGKKLRDMKYEMDYDNGENIHLFKEIAQTGGQLYYNNIEIGKRFVEKDRFILDYGFKLMILVRKDILKNNSSEES